MTAHQTTRDSKAPFARNMPPFAKVSFTRSHTTFVTDWLSVYVKADSHEIEVKKRSEAENPNKNTYPFHFETDSNGSGIV